MKKETQNSEAYLNSVLKNGNGFKTPKNYFSEFDTKSETKIFEEQLPKGTGFTVSDEYFENIDSKILSLTDLQIKNTAKVIPFKKLQPWFSIAAIFIISLCVGLIYFTNQKENISFDDIAQSDIENWIINNPDVLTSIELETVLKEENLEETNFDFTKISTDALEEYLLNDIDIHIDSEI